MTRLMGDATHAEVPQLAALNGLDLVAGYDSGSADIDWTAADWARFPGLPQVHIDQAFNTTVNIQAHVIVIDIEPNAYSPQQAGSLIDLNVTARPTVYCDRAQLAATVASALTSRNFRGDVWLAFPGWQPGQPLPPLPAGCRYVAIQNDYTNPAYDLSLVLDDTWPHATEEDDMPLIIWAADGPAGPAAYLLDGGRLHHITSEADYELLAPACKVVGSPAQRVSGPEALAMAADFPAGNPAVTVTTPPPPPLNLTGTLTPA